MTERQTEPDTDTADSSRGLSSLSGYDWIASLFFFFTWYDHLLTYVAASVS